MSDNKDTQRSEADAELEREIRKGRKFTLDEAIERMAGPGAMKGVSPVTRMQQAEVEIENWLKDHMAAGNGELQVVSLRRVQGSELLLTVGSPRMPCKRGRVPQVAKLIALAHRFEELLRRGQVADYSELARLGRVTRARISQIMNLRSLAPDLQEEVLFLPRTQRGCDLVQLRHLLPIAQVAVGQIQRQLWATLPGRRRE